MFELLEEFITEQYGERCSEYVKGCPCCDAWHFYDELREVDEND